MEKAEDNNNQVQSIKQNKMKNFKLSNQIKFVRLEMHLREKITKIYSLYQHYEILSLIGVLITHHVDRDNLGVIYPLFIINIIVNALYFNIISTYSDALFYNSALFMIKIAYPLPFMNLLDISLHNSLYDFIFCLYVHRFYYIVQLISIYNYQWLRKVKTTIFSKKFETSLNKKKPQINKNKQGELIWKELLAKNRQGAKQLSDRIIQQTIDDLFLQIKYLFHFKPFAITLFLIVTCTMILSYLFQQSEFKYYETQQASEKRLDVRFYENSLYFISITIRTIGYGDISPKTLIGKIIACISSMWGIIFTSLSLYIFNQHFALTEQEKKELNINSHSDNISDFNSEINDNQKIVEQYQEIITDLSKSWDCINQQYNIKMNGFVIDKIVNSPIYQIIHSYGEI